MSNLTRLVFFLFLLAPTLGFAGAPPLVDATWMKANLNTPDLVVLDIQEPKDYRRFHVPGAVNAPYGSWRTSDKGVPVGMLPTTERLEALIGGLGIDNGKTVVVVSTGRGAGDLAAAARVFWTFKVLGHEAVSVLDGGLVSYAQGRNPLESPVNRPEPTKYVARPDPELMLNIEGAKALLANQGGFVDARSAGEFVGLYRGGKEERPGTIPGSKNLPYDWVTEDGSGKLRDAGALEALFAARGIAHEGEQVHFCHSGNRAALTWFAAYAVLGNKQARLYDGSMMEWARQEDLPVEQQIKLCDAC
ncbi:MAG: sulfurtransferase [Pseudomonadota bacterium]|nr:sulfurtransferase [Pseudomonadota bacterium]